VRPDARILYAHVSGRGERNIRRRENILPRDMWSAIQRMPGARRRQAQRHAAKGKFCLAAAAPRFASFRRRVLLARSIARAPILPAYRRRELRAQRFRRLFHGRQALKPPVGLRVLQAAFRTPLSERPP